MKMMTVAKAGLVGVSMLMSGSVYAAEEIHWWFAHTGRLGEVVNEIADKYNASQDKY